MDNGSNNVTCPACQSTKTHVGTRGFDFLDGVQKYSEILITCLDCGTKFKPGGKIEGDRTLQRIAFAIIAAVSLIVIFLASQP